MISYGIFSSAEIRQQATAVVNALAHRDYRSTANVQVYIFKDRVEIVSPGGLPAGMTKADLGIKSIPRNPLLFGMLHRMEAVEHIGSGIRRIRNLCREYGVAEPQIEVTEHWFTMIFPRTTRQVEISGDQTGTKSGPNEDRDPPEVTPGVTPEVRKMLSIMTSEMTRGEIQEKLGLKDEKHFRENYQQVAVKMGLIEMTIPDKPQSSRQRYRLTARGQEFLKSQGDRK